MAVSCTLSSENENIGKLIYWQSSFLLFIGEEEDIVRQTIGKRLPSCEKKKKRGHQTRYTTASPFHRCITQPMP